MPAYTELEWSIGLQAPAVNGDIYEFRVYANTTALSAYSVTPQLTAAGDQTAQIPTAIVHIAGAAVTAAGTGTATATVPTAAMRLSGRAASIDEQEIAIPTALVRLGGNLVTVAGAAVAVTVPTALLQITAVPVAGAAGSVDPIVADVPTATLYLQGQVPPEAQSIDIPTALLYLTAVEVFGRLLAARVASWQTSLTAPTFVVTLQGPEGDA